MRRAGEGRRFTPIAVETIVVLSVALLSALAWTWPLALHLWRGGRSPFDAPFEAWTVDWVQFAIRHPRHLFDADIFAPTRGSLAFSAPLIGIALPTLPLRGLGMSPMAVYNACQIVATACSAASAYLLGRLLLRSRAAAAVVGFAFAFGPVSYALSLQVQMTARAGIPLAAVCAWWLAERSAQRRPVVAPAVALAAVLAWQSSVSLYPAAYALVAVGVVLAVRWRDARQLAVLAAVGAAIAVVLLVAIPEIAVARAYADVAPKHAGQYGASFTQAAPRLSYPSWLHWKGPPALVTSAAFPGVTLLVLAIVGAFTSPRDRRWRVAIAAVAVGAVIAIGSAPTGWRSFAPYRLVLDVVPLAGTLRVYSRAWVVGLLGLGLLAGGAIVWLEHRSSRTIAIGVAALACVCILLEGFSPWNDVRPVAIHPVDVALARLHEPGGVLYLPIASPRRAANDSAFLVQPTIVYRTTAHHRPTVNGYSAYFPPWSGRAVDLAGKLECASARRAFYAAGVRFVVTAHGIRMPPAGFRLIGRYGPERLFALMRPNPTDAGC